MSDIVRVIVVGAYEDREREFDVAEVGPDERADD